MYRYGIFNSWLNMVKLPDGNGLVGPLGGFPPPVSGG